MVSLSRFWFGFIALQIHLQEDYRMNAIFNIYVRSCLQSPVNSLDGPGGSGSVSPVKKLCREVTMDHRYYARFGILRCCTCLAPIVGAFLLFGCMSPNPGPEIQKFANAVAVTATNAAGAFDAVQAGYYEERISAIALETNVAAFNPDDIQPFLPADAIKARLDVLDVLKLYAAKLALLCGNPSETNLDQATDKFASAMKKLDTNLVTASFLSSEKVTPQEINIFTTALNAVADWIIERKEAEEAKKTIEEMKKPIDDICALLASDLQRIHGQLRAEYKQTRQNDDVALIHSWPHLSPPERREELRNLEDLTVSVGKADSTILTLQSAVSNLAVAHASLDDVFTKDKVKASELIDDFSTQAQRISKYYSSLGTNN